MSGEVADGTDPKDEDATSLYRLDSHISHRYEVAKSVAPSKASVKITPHLVAF